MLLKNLCRCWVSRILMFAFLVCFVSPLRLIAQEVQNHTTSESPKLAFTSMVSLGLQGFTTTNEVALEDSLGMAYDVASLIKDPKIGAAVDLSQQQKAEIASEHRALVDELFTMDLVTMTSDQRQEWKKRFIAKDQELQQLLTDKQRRIMMSLRMEKAILEHGLKDVLEADLFGDDLQLDPAEITKTLKEYQEVQQAFQEAKLRLLADANLKVIGLLSEEHRTLVENRLGRKPFTLLLKKELFVQGKGQIRKSLPQASALSRYLKRESVQKDLQLDKDVASRVEIVLDDLQASESEAKLWKAIEEQLSEDQMQQLVSRIALDQCEMFGTVNCLASGVLAQGVQWNDQQRDDFATDVQRIYKDYLQELENTEMSVVYEAFKWLPSRHRECIRNLLIKRQTWFVESDQ